MSEMPPSEMPPNPYDKPPGEEILFTPEGPAKPARGCLFWGCITAVIFAVLGLILIVALAFMGYNMANRMIRDYSSTTPLVLPQVKLDPEDQEALTKRYDDFKAAVDKGEAAELVLSADEINALLNREPSLQGKLYVSIEGDKVTGTLSMPLDFLPFGMGKGRYFNGKATLTVKLVDGELIVHAKDIEANGKKPDANFMQQFEQQNLAKDVGNNPDIGPKIRQLDSIEVKDGKVYLKSRARSESDADAEKVAEKPEPRAEPEKPEAKPGEDSKAEPEKPQTKPEAEPKGDDAGKAPNDAPDEAAKKAA